MKEKIMNILSRNKILDYFEGYEAYFEDFESMDEECLFEIEEIEFVIE